MLPPVRSIVVDRDGVIRARLFLQGYRVHHTTEALVEAAKTIK
jgi:hypothetical protein